MPDNSEPTTNPVDTSTPDSPARCRPGGCGGGSDSESATHLDHATRRIEDVLGDLDRGAHVVEVTGAAGIGRTRLLAEIARLAGVREIRVISGTAPPDGALVPVGAPGGPTDPRCGEVNSGHAPLPGTLPEHRETPRDLPPSSGAANGVRPDRSPPTYAVVDAVHALLEPYLSADDPLVLVLGVAPAHTPGPVRPGDARDGVGEAAPEPDEPSAAARPHRGRRRGGRPALAALTNRERQVAELAGDGLTNREIAAALFVTEKTVEMHLTHVFAKLDVRNRVGLARRLHAAGRGD